MVLYCFLLSDQFYLGTVLMMLRFRQHLTFCSFGLFCKMIKSVYTPQSEVSKKYLFDTDSKL